MKLYLLFLLFGKNPDDVLIHTYDKLNRASSIRYEHERNYFTGDRNIITRATNYVDFKSDDQLIGLRYLSETPQHTVVYNGSENFVLDKKEKTLQVHVNPTIDGLEGGSFYYNSLVTLRRNLPTIILDQSLGKTVVDTLYEGRQAYMVRFTLHKKIMNNFGGFMPISEDRHIHYGLIVTKSSYIPLCLVQTNSVDEHTATVTFKDIKFNPPTPDEKAWYYSTYTHEYEPVATKKEILPLAAGLAAPDLEVLDHESSSKITLKNFRGKTVLLEFWIRNCGPCIESVPLINGLKEKFADLEILAINAHDRKETVDFFVKRYGVKYPVAYGGENAAKQYGVSAFPVVFLINPDGIILYSGMLDENAIKNVLK